MQARRGRATPAASSPAARRPEPRRTRPGSPARPCRPSSPRRQERAGSPGPRGLRQAKESTDAWTTLALGWSHLVFFLTCLFAKCHFHKQRNRCPGGSAAPLASPGCRCRPARSVSLSTPRPLRPEPRGGRALRTWWAACTVHRPGAWRRAEGSPATCAQLGPALLSRPLLLDR